MNRDTKDQGEFLHAARLVPDGREGNIVYARTLRRGEEDTGQKVTVNAGERLVIRKGRLVLDSREIDAQSEKEAGGYAPVANTVWTWYQIAGEELTYFLLIFSLARRIDAAHSLWASGVEELDRARSEEGILKRARLFKALSTAESAIIALHRGITMFDLLNLEHKLGLDIPKSVEKIRAVVRDMRNAFEHIDERAQGKINASGKIHVNALTIFNQPEFENSSILRYTTHSLNFEKDLLAALLDSRELIMEAIDVRAASKDHSNGKW